MSDEEKRVKEIMADYTSAGAKLREIIPAFNWGNLLGDYGEYICAKNYDLSLVKAGTKGYDALDKEGKRVQIKTVSSNDRRKNQASIKISSKSADHLLVIEVDSDAGWEEIYYGPFNKIWRASYRSTDQKTISIGRLKDIQRNTHRPNERVVITLENGDTIVKNTREEMRQHLIKIGRTVSGMSTINKRIKYQGWSVEQAFGAKVPPNYSAVEHYATDFGFEWFPKRPRFDSNMAPLISQAEKRIYLSANHFAKEHDIPNDYVSAKQKKGLNPAEIILKYRSYLRKKNDRTGQFSTSKF